MQPISLILLYKQLSYPTVYDESVQLFCVVVESLLDSFSCTEIVLSLKLAYPMRFLRHLYCAGSPFSSCDLSLTPHLHTNFSVTMIFGPG
jgi:hypothetical protein